MATKAQILEAIKQANPDSKARAHWNKDQLEDELIEAREHRVKRAEGEVRANHRHALRTRFPPHDRWKDGIHDAPGAEALNAAGWFIANRIGSLIDMMDRMVEIQAAMERFKRIQKEVGTVLEDGSLVSESDVEDMLETLLLLIEHINMPSLDIPSDIKRAVKKANP